MIRPRECAMLSGIVPRDVLVVLANEDGGRNMPENLVSCECSLVWKLHKFRTAQRDDATLRCSCGRVLITWSGPYMLVKERVQEPPER